MKKNNKIFPDNFISGSITNQKELDDAFTKYSTFDKTYIQIALYDKTTRKWYEENWPKVHPYLGKDFLKRFQEKEHRSSSWEFYLATVFINKKFKLLEKPQEGPDFCIELPKGKKIWIEAITCEDGEIRVKQYAPGCNQYSIEDMQHNRVLRITSVFWEKFNKFDRYLKNKKIGITSHDYLVIAINGSAIQGHSDVQALFERAMFARGLDMVTFSQKESQITYKPAPPVIRIRKVDNIVEEIKTEPMVMNKFSRISAVLYSGHSVENSPLSDIGSEFLFAYHSNPTNPLPENFFKFGIGIKKNSITNEITCAKQKN